MAEEQSQEEIKRVNVEDDLECFRKLEERLNLVKKYKKSNIDKIGKLRNDLDAVRKSVKEVDKHQEAAIHRAVVGRK
jgi:hypothetical protein